VSKISAFKGNIWEDLPVVSPPSRDWTNELDRILLCSLYTYGFGEWESIRRILRLVPKSVHSFSIHNKPGEIIRARADELLSIIQEDSRRSVAKRQR
jgi:hypothetical protein